jgi:hypothetical protein
VTDAQSYAAQLQAAALRLLKAMGHDTCAPGWFMDSEHGVVCSCGEILGHLSPEGPAPTPTTTLPSIRTHGHVPDSYDPLAANSTVVDPNAPYQLADIEVEILRCVQRLEGGIRYEVQVIEQAEEAEHKYAIAYARALLEASQEPGAADIREARALLATEEERGQMQLLKTMVKTTKAAMHNIRSTLSGLQTVNSSLRATYGAGGSDGPTPGRRPF